MEISQELMVIRDYDRRINRVSEIIEALKRNTGIIDVKKLLSLHRMRYDLQRKKLIYRHSQSKKLTAPAVHIAQETPDTANKKEHKFETENDESSATSDTSVTSPKKVLKPKLQDEKSKFASSIFVYDARKSTCAVIKTLYHAATQRKSSSSFSDDMSNLKNDSGVSSDCSEIDKSTCPKETKPSNCIAPKSIERNTRKVNLIDAESAQIPEESGKENQKVESAFEYEDSEDTDSDVSFVQKRKTTIKGPLKRSHVCSTCKKAFLNSFNLKKHVAENHGGPKEHICPVCKKAFAAKSNLNKHKSTVHNSQTLFQCPGCPKRFSQKSNMETHFESQHGEKRFICDYCGEKRSTKATLQAHIARKHTLVNNFSCEICLKGFTRSSSLARHMRQFHLEHSVKLGKKNLKKQSESDGDE